MTSHTPQRPAWPSTWLALAYIAFGPLVWAACHGLLYAIHWMLCVMLVRGIAIPSLIYAALLGVTGLCVVALIAAIWRPDALGRHMLAGASQEVRQFSRDTMRLLAALSLFGVVAAGAAVVILPICA
jgi:hypothetical protein